MQMITTTRWIDTQATDLTTIDALLLMPRQNETSPIGLNYINWNVQRIFPENRKITLNGKTIEYNYYKYSYEQFSTGMQEDAVTKTGFIIPYMSNRRIQYIINRNSDAQLVLRKLLFYSGKNEIVKNNFSISDDLLIWLICKVYNQENMFESGSDTLANLEIDAVRGFKGDTVDRLNKVEASGESVMNIISTLSFLLESQYLKQITIDMSYRHHSNIELTLSKTVSTDIDRYTGELLSCNNDETCTVLILTLYTEILPLIIQRYQSEVAAGQWGEDKCVDFLSKVANELSIKVAAKVEELTNRPEQLRMEYEADNVGEEALAV